MLVAQMPEIVNIFLKCFGICVAAMSEFKKKKKKKMWEEKTETVKAQKCF